MNVLLASSVLRIRRNSRATVYGGSKSLSRNFAVSVGDTVPVNYLKDMIAPKILEDKDYPEWLPQIAAQGETKMQLLQRFEEGGVDVLSVREAKRLRRLIILETIKTKNLAAATDD